MAGSSRGHVSAARTDPSTHDPPDEHHFLSQALLSFSLDHILAKKKKPKHSEQICARRFVSVYLYQPSLPPKVLFCASVSSCQCTIFFLIIIIIGFVLDFYLVLCIEMQKSILEIKVYTMHMNDCKWNTEAGFLFSYISFMNPTNSKSNYSTKSKNTTIFYKSEKKT